MLKFRNTIDVVLKNTVCNNPLYLQGGPIVNVIAISVYSVVTFFKLIDQNYCGFFKFNLFHNMCRQAEV